MGETKETRRFIPFISRLATGRPFCCCGSRCWLAHQKHICTAAQQRQRYLHLVRNQNDSVTQGAHSFFLLRNSNLTPSASTPVVSSRPIHQLTTEWSILLPYIGHAFHPISYHHHGHRQDTKGNMTTMPNWNHHHPATAFRENRFQQRDGLSKLVTTWHLGRSGRAGETRAIAAGQEEEEEVEQRICESSAAVLLGRNSITSRTNGFGGGILHDYMIIFGVHSWVRLGALDEEECCRRRPV